MKRFMLAALGLLGSTAGLYCWHALHFQETFLSPLPSVSNAPSASVDPLLNQTFQFLGKGGTSVAFLGEDGHTVLKLFKHHHLTFKSWLSSTSFPGRCDALRIQQLLGGLKKHPHKRQSFFFQSCRIAYDTLQEETGLIYLCLQPSTHFVRPIKLIDTWGIAHHIDLSRAEFALQHKAELFFPYLKGLLQHGRRQEIKEAIDALLETLKRRCRKGIGDRDPNLLINFGYLEGKVIAFDLGSYFLKPALTHPPKMAQELYFASYALQKWLEKHCPDLLEYLLDCITQVASLE